MCLDSHVMKTDVSHAPFRTTEAILNLGEDECPTVYLVPQALYRKTEGVLNFLWVSYGVIRLPCTKAGCSTQQLPRKINANAPSRQKLKGSGRSPDYSITHKWAYTEFLTRWVSYGVLTIPVCLYSCYFPQQLERKQCPTWRVKGWAGYLMFYIVQLILYW